MRIGVVSDTHSRPLPAQMMKDFEDVDFIIHAGDFCDWDDYENFVKLKTVKAVYGNMDSSKIRQRLKRKEIIPCENFQIGIFHGEGSGNHILETVKEEFQKDKVDVVVFGHSHRALNETINHVLYFNPGSPNDTIFAPYCSYGLLKINEKKISGEIIKVKGKNG